MKDNVKNIEQHIRCAGKSKTRGVLGSNEKPIEVRLRIGEKPKDAIRRRLSMMGVYGD